MTYVVEGKSSFFVGSQAFLVDETKETAWAERKIHYNPAYKWVVGRYVEADKPNNNMQMWALDEIHKAQPTITYAPMNMLHQPRRIVGAFVDTELMLPKSAEVADNGEYVYENPYVEALGVFWKYYFRDELEVVEAAHAEGQLFFSMECVSKSVTCDGDAGCGEEFEYRGPKSETYCAHINNDTSIKRLNNPIFLAGALLVPPVKPGWSGAEIRELSKLVKEHADEAEQAYEGFKADAPELSPEKWEMLMLQVMKHAKSAD